MAKKIYRLHLAGSLASIKDGEQLSFLVVGEGRETSLSGLRAAATRAHCSVSVADDQRTATVSRKQH